MCNLLDHPQGQNHLNAIGFLPVGQTVLLSALCGRSVFQRVREGTLFPQAVLTRPSFSDLYEKDSSSPASRPTMSL